MILRTNLVLLVVLLGTNTLLVYSQPCLGYLTVVLPGSPFTGPADITEATDNYDGRGQDLGSHCGLIIHGNDQGNQIFGGPGTDQIYGYGGADTIYGQEGADLINGHDGDDSLWGGSDNTDGTGRADVNDVVDGGLGDDTIRGGSQNAAGAQASDGDDVLMGGGSDDTIYGGNQNAAGSSGDDGNDSVDGGDGDDVLYGGNQNDTGSGNDGNDTMIVGSGTNTIYGGNLNSPGGSGTDNANGGGDDIDAVNETVDALIVGGSSDDISAGMDTIRFDQSEVAIVTCDADDYCEPDGVNVEPTEYTFQGGVPEQAGAPLGLNQSTLVIYVRASGDNTANLNALRTSEQAEFATVSRFFDESSFNQVSFAYTHAPAAGWYQLPRTYNDYMWTPADITAAQATGNAAAIANATNSQNLVQDFWGFFTDSMQAAQDNGNNVANFSQVAVVIIGPFHRGTSYGTTNFTLRNAAGQNFQVNIPVVVVSTNTGWSRTAHEFGHAFGHFGDLYGAPNRRAGQWDIMDCTDCGSQTTGWNKTRAGWYSAFPTAVQVVPRPTGVNRVDFTTTLVPYETAVPAAGTVHSIRLDVGGGMHLYIENRQRLPGQAGSQSLPSNGVIITDAGGPLAAQVRLFGGPLGVGGVFTDQSYGNLRVSVAADPTSARNMLVTVGWGADPFFDLKITPWTPPPWESPDIWIDSPSNGIGVFEFVDAFGRPIRNGDRPRVGVANQIFARITNEGNVAANNVRVSYYVTTPAGIGDTGNWTLLDRVTIPSIAAGATIVSPSVVWQPPAGSHTCIIVRIDHQPGELNANNNEAQENINDFDTTSNSPWTHITSEVTVANPMPIPRIIRLEVSDLPAGWTATVSDRFVELGPGETTVVHYTIDPGDDTNAGRCLVDLSVAGWILEGELESLLGGVTAAVHLIHPSQVGVEWFDENEYPREPNREDPFKPSVERMGARVVIVSNGDLEGIPVTIEVMDANGATRSTASGTTDVNGTVTLTMDMLDGDVVFEAGEKYIVRVFADGSTCVQHAQTDDLVISVPPGTTSDVVNLDFRRHSEPLFEDLAYCAATFAVDYDVLREVFAEVGQSFTTSVVDPRFDQQQARQCLDEFGGGLFLRVCLDENDEFGWRIAEMVGSYLSEIGIDVEFLGLDPLSLQQAIADGTCNIVIDAME
jgi:Ca2+-binding RTX toxin-like protein